MDEWITTLQVGQELVKQGSPVRVAAVDGELITIELYNGHRVANYTLATLVADGYSQVLAEDRMLGYLPPLNGPKVPADEILRYNSAMYGQLRRDKKAAGITSDLDVAYGPIWTAFHEQLLQGFVERGWTKLEMGAALRARLAESNDQ